MALKIEGDYTFRAAREAVYQALQDDTLIRAAMPGGLRFVRVSPTTYEAEMEVSVPRLAGRYAGTVTVVDTAENESYELLVRGSGAHRHVEARGTIGLESLPDGTLVRYRGETDAVGNLNRLAEVVAQRVVVEVINFGLHRLEAEMRRRAAPQRVAAEDGD